ncbi:MAG: hypothetical protein JOY68_04190, partial [Candidatus Dormibacteraeota bacterium]|nr:hypothetical protein [Candidatus Dormibacteraeota bacterium]
MKGVLRAVPRVALAAIFIDSGRRVFMNPTRQVQQAEQLLPVLPPRIDLFAKAHAA